ncbi:MAG: CheR family methyltransferase [Promethearchaeota archaeon]
MRFSSDLNRDNSIDRIHVDDKAYNTLIQLLGKKTGLNFEYYNKKFIIKRIKSRMIRVSCNTLSQYYDYVSSNKAEIKEFIDGFTVNYTFFFRDYDVFETFQDLIIQGLNVSRKDIKSNIKPDVAKLDKFSLKKNAAKIFHKNRYLTEKPEKYYVDIFVFFNILSYYKKMKQSRNENNCINIWSCPCATGEEPYSLAMILDNLEKQVPRFPKFKIVASDISHKAIKKAKIGIYTDDSMKEISDYFESKYFIKKKTNYRHNKAIKEEIKRKIEFIEEDVTKGHKLPLKYDIIFCRYLLIYFNRKNRDRFLKILENRLNENGILILGKTETLFDSWGSLQLVDSRNRIYVKSYSKLYK